MQMALPICIKGGIVMDGMGTGDEEEVMTRFSTHLTVLLPGQAIVDPNG